MAGAALAVPATAQYVALKMIDGEIIVVGEPFPSADKAGKIFFLVATPFDVQRRPQQLFAVREIASVERARYVRENNLHDNPCAFEWKVQLKGRQAPVMLELPVLAELPESATDFTREQVLDLYLRGKSNRDALPYGGRFVRLRCNGESNFVADGLTVEVIDPVTRSHVPRQLNVSRLVSLEQIPADKLDSALSRAQPASVAKLPDMTSRPAAPVSPPPPLPAPVVPAEGGRTDGTGRKVINGPVGPGFYSNVRIVSGSVGIDAPQDFSVVTVVNSVIEAPVCVRTSGYNTVLRNNELRCGLCVEFVGGALIGNELTNNTCTGRGTNRPDIFGW